MKSIEEQLIEHEGLETKVYHCPAGRLTIGVGRNLEDKGITRDEALYLLRNDISECKEDLRDLLNDFDGLSDERQNVLIDMRFNLGPSRFRQFKKMIRAVDETNFEQAALEMKDSSWYQQVGNRAETLVDMMRG